MDPSHRDTFLNWLEVDQTNTTPLYLQISNQIREAVIQGDLAKCTKLPASRQLAQDLSVSRTTTLEAYALLQTEGLVETRHGAGTFVVKDLSAVWCPDHKTASRKPLQKVDGPPKFVQALLDQAESSHVAFQPGVPAFDAFPRALWSRLLANSASRSDRYLLDYAHVGGYSPLRYEIANYLRASRGVICEQDQVIVVTSVRAAITSVCKVLWQPGCRVAVEDPGYSVARRVLAGQGLEIEPIAVDEQGFRVSDLIEGPTDCVGAYLTPAHHWPTGVALSPDRRRKLLDWAIANQAWIIEDDYDSEFRFDSRPLGTMHALESDRVIYVGTFSKTFAPSVRTAYLVVPRALVDRFEVTAFNNATEPALHIQSALSDLMSQGHFERHIRRMHALYADRRLKLVSAMRDAFGRRLRIVSPPGGLQILAILPKHVSVEAVSERAMAVDLVARPVAGNYVNQPPLNALHLGFAAIPEDKIVPAVKCFAAAIEDLFQSGP